MDLAELHLPGDVSYVGLARSIVVAAARQCGMPEERLQDLKIAVSEIATHAVLCQGADRRVVLVFGAREAGFEVHVREPAPVRTEDSSGALERDWSVDGALGLTLVEGLADDVSFAGDDGGETVMRFAFSEDGSGQSAARREAPERP